MPTARGLEEFDLEHIAHLDSVWPCHDGWHFANANELAREFLLRCNGQAAQHKHTNDQRKYSPCTANTDKTLCTVGAQIRRVRLTAEELEKKRATIEEYAKHLSPIHDRLAEKFTKPEEVFWPIRIE